MASEIATSSGRISRGPQRIAAREPSRPPMNWPTAIAPPSAHSTWPPSPSTTTETRLLVRFSALVCAVARTSPMPSSVTRLSV